MTVSSTDVLILGGGVIGLSIARELRKLGVEDITLVERGTCGRGSTWAAAGMLSPQAETDELGPFFELCSSSRDMYPAFAEELREETGVDIELDRTGTLYVAFDDKDAQELTSRYEWQRQAGLDVERLSGSDIRKLEPQVADDIDLGLYFPNDWQVENRRLATALRKYADLNGINVLENTAAQRLVLDSGRITAVETTAGTMSAANVVVATGAWTSFLNLGQTMMPIQVEPVRGQMVCVKGEERPLRHVIYTHRGYLVPRMDGRILSGSTSEHVGFEVANTEEAVRELTRLASDILPNSNLKASDTWAGLRPCSPDGLPVIGHLKGVDGLMIATGHYRNGILLAPVTARLVADNIVNGRLDDVFSTFGPQRFSRAVGV
ncbi:MAG: glycine oxidase ThiO [Pyrinomonadaceae bacterium]